MGSEPGPFESFLLLREAMKNLIQCSGCLYLVQKWVATPLWIVYDLETNESLR
jgi:hypothetical protein